MRTRETNLTYSDPAVYYYSGGSLTTTGLVGTRKKIVDCEPQGLSLAQRLRVSVLPFRPVQIETYVHTAQPLRFSITDGGSFDEHGGWYPSSDYYPSLGPNIPPLNESAIAFCVNAAIGESRSGSWDALTSAAEFSKTASMIGSLANRIFDAGEKTAQLAKRWRKSPGQTSIDVFNQLWLEGRYGWRPLFGEIDNVAQAAAEAHYEKLRKEGHSYYEEDLSTGALVTHQHTSRADFHYHSSRVGKRTYRGFALSVGMIGHVDFKPIQTAWELTTLSFVVDRFIDIGGFLSAVAPVPGVGTPCSGYSVKDEYTDTYRTEIDDGGTGYTVTQYNPCIQARQITAYNRSPLLAQPPRLLPRLDKLFVLDLAAIAIQRYGRIIRILL